MVRNVLSVWVLGTLAVAPRLTAQARYGIVGGVVSSSLAVANDDDSEVQKSRLGFAAGVTMATNAGKKLQFTPEAIYVQKGTKLEEAGFSATLKFAYLEVPVLLRYSFSPTGEARPFLTAGPAIAFKLGCTITGSFEGVSASGDCDEAEDEDDLTPKSTDVGFVFGGGITLGDIAVSVRYNMGLTKLYADKPSTKNRVLMLMVSYGL